MKQVENQLKPKQFNFQSDGKFECVEANLKGEKKYYIEGYASTTDKDLAGEVINDNAQSSMLKQFRNRNITIDVEHEEWYDDAGKQLPKPKGTMIPVAKVVEAKQDTKGTWIKAEMNDNIERFKEVWGSIKGGFLNSFSIGFFPVTQVGNVISDLNIVNLTLTGTPVNKEATFAPVLKSAVAYLKSIKSESENKMENTENTEVKQENVTETPEVVEPKNELKTEEEIKAEVEKEPVTPTVEVKPEVSIEPDKTNDISKVIEDIMDKKMKEFENRFVQKSVDEPKQETIAEQPVPKEPEASQEVPSKPVSPLGMIKAFKEKNGDLGFNPNLKALVEDIPTEVTDIKKSPLQLVR